MIAPLTLIAQAAAPSLSDSAGWFDGIDPNQRFVLTIIAVGCATGVLITLGSVMAAMWGSVQRRQIEADFKRELLDRGLSADDIAKIVESAAPPEDGLGRWLASCSKKR